MDHRSQVFASVFPVPSLSHTTPTPVATPDLGFSGYGQPFGGPSVSYDSGQHRDVARNSAWSTATRFLSLKRSGISGDMSFGVQTPKRVSAEADAALHYLLVGEGRRDDAQEEHEEDLVDWYRDEALLLFSQHVQPMLVTIWEEEIELHHAWGVLEETQRILEQAQNQYLQPFNDYILPRLQVDPARAELTNWRFRRAIHTVFAHCLPQKRFLQTLSYVLYDAGCTLFGIYLRLDGLESRTTHENISACRRRLTHLLINLERVGLGGQYAQKSFAYAMNKLLDSFIVSHYLKVDWYYKVSIVPHLRAFITHGFCPLTELVMECLGMKSSTVGPDELQVWQDMALGRLGRARVENLFDFAINYDKGRGAIHDIMEYLKLPNEKQFLTNSFAKQVSDRLLHPGATTTYILNVYILIIRTFHRLEPKGVLLERVARPIRRYLNDREDTARIIITSLLTPLNDENRSRFAAGGSGGELSYEIAREMKRPFAKFHQDEDEDLNWNDPDWQPLPMDASPEYKKSKVHDIMWFLLTLWDRESFINELKNILGDHLLRCQDPEYEREIRLLELIKVRLGDNSLQACEVMLRDVLDSKRINTAIRHSSNVHKGDDKGHLLQTPQNTGPRTPRPRRGHASTPAGQHSTPSANTSYVPELNAQIISSFFWPSLREDEFLIPAQIEALQKDYESRFERIKGMRKLKWMNALGESTVTLEFEDRTEEFEHLTPWQVSIVYAFQPQPDEEQPASGKGKGKGKAKNPGITRTVSQLEEMLEMEESLVRQAVGFWIGKSVLRQISQDTYEVIENLSSSSTDSAAAAAAKEIAEVQAETTSAAVRSQADLFQEKKEVYMAFVQGMLNNAGNLPLPRMHMMMKMMVQGGFPFGVDELGGLLEEMVAQEKVVALGGGIYGKRK